MSTDADQVEKMAQELLSPIKGMGIGPTFIGICFDALLMGVILSQMITWIPMARNDAKHVQFIVGFAALSSLAGTTFTWSSYMNAFVYNFGSYTRFISFEYFAWYGVLDILVVVPVQIFFAERSVRINKNNKILMAINAIMITATAAMACAATVALRGHNIFTRTPQVLAICTAWPAVCIATHVWLTSTILFGLWRSRSEIESTNRLLIRLIVVMIESQIPSTIVAILIMIVIIVDTKSPLLPFIVIVHPKVFCVGLLAMVNLRHTWRIHGKIPTSYAPDLSQRSGTGMHVSLGSTVEDFGLKTPKGDVDSIDQLSRQQSFAKESMMEAGMPLQDLKSDGWTGHHLYK